MAFPVNYGGEFLKVIVIDNNTENQRLDKFLMKYFNKAGKSFIYKMLRKKRIKYNKGKAIGNEILKSGDSIQLYLSEETIDSFMESKIIKSTSFDFSIIYEDDNIIICDKPAGLSVQKDSHNTNDSLNDQLLFYLYKKGEYLPSKDSVFTPSICNRLDRNTGGIVLFGKNFKAVKALNDIIKKREIDKFYLTVLEGNLKNDGIIEAYHLKDRINNKSEISSEFKEGAKKVITKYKKIAENGKFNLVEVDLVTGKSHQIRASFKFIGCNVIGDTKYGNSEINRFFKIKYGFENQFLHSYKIVFKDDCGFFDYLKEKKFIAPLDDIKEKIVFDIFGLKGEDYIEKY